MTKTRLGLLAAILLFLALPLSAKAFLVKSGPSVYISAEETVAGNLYAASQIITVDGAVSGDVICAGQTININGAVEGDVICAGQTININGAVKGSVRLAGNDVIINGQVARNAMAFGATISLASQAQVDWDLLLAGATGEIRGKVGRDLHGAAANLIVAGDIGGDVRFKLDDKVRRENRGLGLDQDKTANQPLTVTKTAKIGGNLVYSGANEALIDQAAEIKGEVTHNLPPTKNLKPQKFLFWGWLKLYSVFAALVIGLVLISLWREPVKQLTDKMMNRAAASIGWGLVIMFLTPIIAILLLITLIGIPLSALLLGVWLIALCLSRILVGIMVGRKIMDKLWHKKRDSLIWSMIIGVVISWAVFAIPVIGWLLCLVALWWGLGGIWLYFRKA